MATVNYETDVLVVGGGSAGFMATRQALSGGAKVLFATKGQLTQNHAMSWTPSGMGVYPFDEADAEAFLKEMVERSGGLTTQKFGRALLKTAIKIPAEFDALGIHYRRPDDSRSQIQNARRVDASTSGSALKQAFTRFLAQNKDNDNLTLLQDVMICDLLTNKDAVVGAVGINMINQEVIAIAAKTTILCTNGYVSIFKHHRSHDRDTGDGHAMGYRAGAELMQMEMAFGYNVGKRSFTNCDPSFRALAHYVQPLVYEDEQGGPAWYLNNRGERFMEKYDPELMENTDGPSAYKAMCNEIREGRGGPNGGIYISFSHMPANAANALIKKEVGDEKFLGLIEKANVAVNGEEGLPHPHHTQGCFVVDENNETTLPNLFFCGRGGFDGASPFSGIQMMCAITTGYISGEAAAKRAESVSMPSIDTTQVDKFIAQVEALLSPESGVRGYQIKEMVHEAVQSSSINLTEEGFTSALEEIDRIKSEELPKLYVANKNTSFNLDLVDALEAINMVLCAEAYMQSSLYRSESRVTGYYRFDYPEQNDKDWLAHVYVKQDGNKMSVYKKPADLSYYPYPA